MANFTNFAILPAQPTPPVNVTNALSQGFQAGSMPFDELQKQRQMALKNAIDAVTAQFAVPTALSGIQKNQALSQQAQAIARKNLVDASLDPGKYAAYEYAQQQAGNLAGTKAQWVAPQAQASIEQALAAANLSTTKAGQPLSEPGKTAYDLNKMTPGTPEYNSTLAVLKNMSLKGMLAGQQYTDSTNPNITHMLPTIRTATSQQAAETMQVVRNFLDQNSPISYIGTGASAQVGADRALVANKSANPIARSQAAERLIQNAVGYQLLNETIASQLNALGIKTTDSTIQHMRDSILQGATPATNVVVNNLPQSLQKEAKRRFNLLQQGASAVRNKFYNQGFPTDANGNPVASYKSNVQHLLPKEFMAPQFSGHIISPDEQKAAAGATTEELLKIAGGGQ